MQIIKILMLFAETSRCGAQSFAMNILRSIDRTKFKIDFAVYNNPNGGYGDEIVNAGSEIHILPKFTPINYFTYRRECKRLFAKYDVIHGNVTSTARVYLQIAKQCGCKTILHSHSAGYRGNMILQFIKKIFTANAKKYADYWFACSDKAALRVFGKEYAKHPKFRFIPNAIAVENYLFDEGIRNRIRKENNISDNSIMFGHVGSFTTPKNHTFLLDIFKQILQRNDNACLVLLGDGPLKENTIRYAKQIGVIEKTIFVGNVDNVNEYMMGMDTLIFPSLFEGLPVTIVEAQATGLYSVISSNITEDVNLTNIVKYVSLDTSASVWSDIALQSPVVNRKKYNKDISASSFNVEKSVKLLEELYTK